MNSFICFFVFLLFAFSHQQTVQVDADSLPFAGSTNARACGNLAGTIYKCAQTFVTSAYRITQITVYSSYGYQATATIALRDGPNGNILGYGTVSTGIISGRVALTVNIDVAVTPSQVYWITFDCGSTFCYWDSSNNNGGYGFYPDGNGWSGTGSGSEIAEDFLFQTRGYITPELVNAIPNWAQTGANGGCSLDGYGAMIFQPTHNFVAVSIDFTGPILLSLNYDLTMVFYESTTNSPSSTFNRITTVTRNVLSGGIAAKNITNGLAYTMRADRYYMVGYTSTGTVWGFANCGGGYGNANFTVQGVYFQHFSYNYGGFGATWNGGINGGYNNMNIKIWTAVAPVSTSGEMTSSPLTSSPLTTSPLTTGEVTTGSVTSGAFTSGAVTSSAVTSAEFTSSPVTSSPVTSSPLTSAGVTSGEATSSPITSAELTSSPVTSSPVTSAQVTSGSFTSGQLSFTSGSVVTTGESVGTTGVDTGSETTGTEESVSTTGVDVTTGRDGDPLTSTSDSTTEGEDSNAELAKWSITLLIAMIAFNL